MLGCICFGKYFLIFMFYFHFLKTIYIFYFLIFLKMCLIKKNENTRLGFMVSTNTLSIFFKFRSFSWINEEQKSKENLPLEKCHESKQNLPSSFKNALVEIFPQEDILPIIYPRQVKYSHLWWVAGCTVTFSLFKDMFVRVWAI